MKPLDTKDKILKAARQLFVEHGFAGTAMGKIAKQAGVNHSLLFHHFGNKAKLWGAVKADIVKDAKVQSTILPATDLKLEDFLQQLLANQIQFYRDNPDIVQLISWQRIEAGNESDIGVTLSEESQAWLDAIKAYQAKGEIAPQHKPEYIVTLILSIASTTALDNNQLIDNEEAYLEFCVAGLVKCFAAN
ncbi:MAG: hypothetical protein CMF50_09125 [Legionellales bacterium]|nr:hypothetical protein [Legionellales bacterium]|tara:strand:- start:671 stop:1240 length:570 start_codon:yes stop_codon:yes gene_type:complete